MEIEVLLSEVISAAISAIQSLTTTLQTLVTNLDSRLPYLQLRSNSDLRPFGFRLLDRLNDTGCVAFKVCYNNQEVRRYEELKSFSPKLHCRSAHVATVIK